MNRLAIFKKPILSIMLVVALTGLAHPSLSAMSNGAKQGNDREVNEGQDTNEQTPNTQVNGTQVTDTAVTDTPANNPEAAAAQAVVTTTTTTRSKRPHGDHDDSVILPELRRQKIEPACTVCINAILPENVLQLIFNWVAGDVKFQDDPIKNLVTLKTLCKTVSPVCKNWRVLAIWLLDFDLKKMLDARFLENELGAKEIQLFANIKNPVDEDTKLQKLCLAKRVLNSVMHDAKIVWYTRVSEFVLNRFWRSRIIPNQFDTNTYFRDLSQAITPMHAECMANDKFANSLTHENLSNSRLLMLCIEKHDVKKIKLLVILGVPLNTNEPRNEHNLFPSCGDSPLHRAIRFPHQNREVQNWCVPDSFSIMHHRI